MGEREGREGREGGREGGREEEEERRRRRRRGGTRVSKGHARQQEDETIAKSKGQAQMHARQQRAGWSCLC